MSNQPKNESLQLEKSADSHLDWLRPAERYALDYFLEKKSRGESSSFPLSDSVAEKIFNLFLHGKTFAEIRALNPTISLGQLVYAAVQGDWNARREEWQSTAVERAKTRAVMAITEGVQLAADMMAAINKQHRDNLAKYLQTGDVTFLAPAQEGLKGATDRATITQLRELAALISTLTGQDNKKSPPSSERSDDELPPLETFVRTPSAATKRIAELAAQKKASEK